MYLTENGRVQQGALPIVDLPEGAEMASVLCPVLPWVGVSGSVSADSALFSFAGLAHLVCGTQQPLRSVTALSFQPHTPLHLMELTGSSKPKFSVVSRNDLSGFLRKASSVGLWSSHLFHPFPINSLCSSEGGSHTCWTSTTTYTAILTAKILSFLSF